MSMPSTETIASGPATSGATAAEPMALGAMAPESPTSHRRLGPSGQTLAVLAIMTALLGITVVLGRDFLPEGPLLPSPTLPWWVLALAFAATESSVLHIQRSRQARSVSMSELPLVLGLFFASPVALLVGRLVGAAATLVVLRRCPPLKTCFNLALFAAETVVCLAVFSAVSSWGGGNTVLTWAGAYAGAFAANVLGGCAVSLVISVYDGGLRLRQLLHDSLAGQSTAPMVVTLGLVAVTSLAASPLAAWLLSGFGALLLLAYRGYASLSDRHLNLERLYRFSQAVSTSPEIDQVMASVLGEARALLRSGPGLRSLRRRRRELSSPRSSWGPAAGWSGRRNRPRPRTSGCWSTSSRAPGRCCSRGGPEIRRHGAGWPHTACGRQWQFRSVAARASSASCWWPTGRATSAPSRRTTSCCWRRWPTTPVSPCATAN